MIRSAAEFIELRTSTVQAEYYRAAHEEAPIEVWWEIVRKHRDMRRWVIHNKTVPVEILEALVTDEDVDVRCAVATKRKAPHALLEQLARDPDSGVRHCVACNAKTPRELLEILTRDEEAFVAEAASARLSAEQNQ